PKAQRAEEARRAAEPGAAERPEELLRAVSGDDRADHDAEEQNSVGHAYATSEERRCNRNDRSCPDGSETTGRSMIKTFGPVDGRSLDQLCRCMEAGKADRGVLCADHHPGYSQPIGGVVAYRDYVSPSGVG